MAQVAPAEGDLRRVIGDGEGQPDGEVAGLTEADLLALYRDMVLLRTYDERSLVYHRQGRIGTYAIYWGHEAMQAGAIKYPFDRSRSEQLMAEAGFSRAADGFYAGPAEGRLSIELKASAGPGDSEAAGAMAGSWRQEGFEMTEALIPAARRLRLVSLLFDFLHEQR